MSVDSQVYFFLLPSICNESQLGSVLVTQATAVDHDTIYQGAIEPRGTLGHGGGCSIWEEERNKGKHEIPH